jgi:hypothetical protein
MERKMSQLFPKCTTSVFSALVEHFKGLSILEMLESQMSHLLLEDFPAAQRAIRADSKSSNGTKRSTIIPRGEPRLFRDTEKIIKTPFGYAE